MFSFYEVGPSGSKRKAFNGAAFSSIEAALAHVADIAAFSEIEADGSAADVFTKFGSVSAIEAA